VGVVAILCVSALIGFALGGSFSWLAIAITGMLLALPAAVVLHVQGFGALSGIAIIVACLTVNQIAYIGGFSIHRSATGPVENKQRQRSPSTPIRVEERSLGVVACSRLAEECFLLGAIARDPEIASELIEKGNEYLRSAAP
jgi:hypothetical protein